MKRLTLLLLFFVCAFPSNALETMDGHTVTGRIMGVYRPYPTPELGVPDLVPPPGYECIYLSHYGRHGSRYIQYDSQYVCVAQVLKAAARDGKLTVLGRRLHDEYMPLFPLLEGKAMELTQLGVSQQETIAGRMVENFPALFKEGALLEAIATPSSRTMQSMEAFCAELSRCAPGTSIDSGPATDRLCAVNPYSEKSPSVRPSDIVWKGPDSPASSAIEAFAGRVLDTGPFIGRIFSDTSWVEANIDARAFMLNLFYVAVSIQNTPVDDPDFCKYFLLNEMTAIMRIGCVTTYCHKGLYSGSGTDGRQWALSNWILEDICRNARRDIRNGKISARFRFGHDGCLMGLFSMMGIPPWGVDYPDLDSASMGWDQSLTPMASNLQIVFFRNKYGRKLVRVLFNEQDLALPIRRTGAHYYRYGKFMRYCSACSRKSRRVLRK